MAQKVDAPPAYPQEAHHGDASGQIAPQGYYNQPPPQNEYYASPNPYQQQGPGYGPPQGQCGPPQGQYGQPQQPMYYQQGPPPPGMYPQQQDRGGPGGGLMAGLCAGLAMKQSDITRYVATVQPCLDGKEGQDNCTDGAICQYKDLLTTSVYNLAADLGPQDACCKHFSDLEFVYGIHFALKLAVLDQIVYSDDNKHSHFQQPYLGTFDYGSNRITEQCLRNQTHNDLCKLENLQCVCNSSNSISNNTYFDPLCLYETCYNDFGRQSWMGAFARACNDVDQPVLNIPAQWRPHIPSWYGTSSTISATSSATASATTSAAAGLKPILSKAAMAGIATGSLLAVAVFFGLGCWGWRSQKKIKRKDREKAQLADAMHPQGGVAARIDQLTYGAPSRDSLTATTNGGWNWPQPQPHLCAPPRNSYRKYMPYRNRGRSRPNHSTTQGFDNVNGLTPTELEDQTYYIPAPLTIHGVTNSPDSVLDKIAVGPNTVSQPCEAYSLKLGEKQGIKRAEYDEFGHKIVYR
ncbi:hypothetical protein ACEQ8H_008902 [Pleosporales sp. CAS-2024a]